MCREEEETEFKILNGRQRQASYFSTSITLKQNEKKLNTSVHSVLKWRQRESRTFMYNLCTTFSFRRGIKVFTRVLPQLDSRKITIVFAYKLLSSEILHSFCKLILKKLCIFHSFHKKSTSLFCSYFVSKSLITKLMKTYN